MTRSPSFSQVVFSSIIWCWRDFDNIARSVGGINADISNDKIAWQMRQATTKAIRAKDQIFQDLSVCLPRNVRSNFLSYNYQIVIYTLLEKVFIDI